MSYLLVALAVAFLWNLATLVFEFDSPWYKRGFILALATLGTARMESLDFDEGAVYCLGVAGLTWALLTAYDLALVASDVLLAKLLSNR